jgi:glycosyltransferase involved in cell wall biosynthesis
VQLAFITPTKDRPTDLKKMLDSFASQTRKPDQVIIVDASEKPVKSVCDSINNLKIDYIRWDKKPSAAAQRNGGLTLVKDDIDLVCFFDDDQVLHNNALEKMLSFWQLVGPEVGGASFNQANYVDKRPARLKKSQLSNALGLYCRQPGKVAPSGWQSLYGKVDKNTEVEWLSSQAMVVRRNIMNEFKFDEFFDGYSYLEDVDFSYSISRKYKMAIVADAFFEHYHSTSGRVGAYQFGKVETRNRKYIVKKHHLSILSFYFSAFIRGCITLKEALFGMNKYAFHRALGNIAGLFRNEK